jgi:hypothetical protein
MPEHMRAVVQQAFGGPEVLQVAEVDRPVPLAYSTSATWPPGLGAKVELPLGHRSAFELDDLYTPVESLQVGEVMSAGQPPAFQVDQPRRGQCRLSPGQLGGVGDAQQVTQHAAGRIRVRITGRAGSPAVTGQDPLPQFIGGQPSGRYLGEQHQILHRVPAPRPVPRPAPRQPRAAVPRPPAALRTATDTSTASALRWAPTKTAASRDRRTWSSTPASPARNSRNDKTCGTATTQARAIAYAYPRRTGLTEPATCRC